MSLRTTRTPTLTIGTSPRVDLLPPSEVRRRETIARARTWATAAVGALLVTVVMVGGAFAYNLSADMRLATERARTQALLASIAELSDVSRALSLRGTLQGLRIDAMAGDLSWTAVVATVGSRLPAGVQITDYALVAGPVPDVATPDAPGASGTVTVTSAEPLSLVALVGTLRGSPGIQLTEVEELTGEDGAAGYEYRLRISVDQSVYTGDFAEGGAES
ncbi:hypothetical protein [Microbacterium sp.]|jgi:hypothetical protein|uniref:hypothetical protein n=1 Tax=Microbacterium sp. TaxID=51671 RepID=UPI0037C863D0